MFSTIQIALIVTILAPLISSAVVGVRMLLGSREPSERMAYQTVFAGLVLCAAGGLTVLGCFTGVIGEPVRGEVEFGDWLRIHDFEIPMVMLVDGISITISLFAVALTALVARFSRTYLHKEPGFVRFFLLLGLFVSGTQLVALGGALELFFAGWEIIGISSAFFIGFFHERDEPVRSSVRAFSTYRLADAGLLIGTVTAFEFLGSTRFSALDNATGLAAGEATILALLFLLSAMGKSAQLPFSGWLPRAMEGPTPSSALFYGAVSIHAGLFLLLRVWPAIEPSLVARFIGTVVGMSTALYATAVARTHSDAKGALAHATLAQVGLIVAEICLGWIELALVHMVCHALLRLGQYLKAPNMIHDSHRLGHDHRRPSLLERWSPRLAERVYAESLHRLRLDDRIDAAFSPVLRLATALDRADRRFRAALSLDGPAA